MSTLTSRFDAKVSGIAGPVSDLASGAADAFDLAANETAESLHAAASSIRKVGYRGSKAIEDLTQSTADKLDDAGSYVRKHDLKRTIGESRQLVRRYPAESLALAAGVGFLTGIAVRRLTHTCDKS
jgi:ElaB/YqjD/DUF883 family membrane-anchored ribosome-binding protein